jgi:hypothetical protein
MKIQVQKKAAGRVGLKFMRRKLRWGPDSRRIELIIVALIISGGF